MEDSSASEHEEISSEEEQQEEETVGQKRKAPVSDEAPLARSTTETAKAHRG
eukprot:TRINITY_DN899_c0_g1_i1.p4 TRINITY_DN899_c0_g1~~TRINITY_DN899_c0_g1_i1.p4  ORF type:complete len:52 (+),score=14.49 TRINITY_DN899_c0_g1_i1:328-483(+)